MLFDTEELEVYLNRAFEFFSSSDEGAFNFVDIAYNRRPISRNFGDHIHNLGKAFLERRPDLSSDEFLKLLAPLLVSCIIINTNRSHYKGTHLLPVLIGKGIT